MRKFTVAALACLCAVLAITPATASFDPHFSVIAKTKSGRAVDGGFAFREKLLDPARPVNKVGYDNGVCKVISQTAARCRVIFHLDGEISGSGTIRASGVFNRGTDERININGGSGDFEGAAGKVIVDDFPGRGQLISFDVVR
jgi:hypothetical protein